MKYTCDRCTAYESFDNYAVLSTALESLLEKGWSIKLLPFTKWDNEFDEEILDRIAVKILCPECREKYHAES